MEASGEVSHIQAELKVILEDQERLRQDLKIVPANSAVHKRYLEKFDKQETQIEEYQAQVKKLQGVEEKQRKEFEDFLANFSAD